VIAGSATEKTRKLYRFFTVFAVCHRKEPLIGVIYRYLPLQGWIWACPDLMDRDFLIFFMDVREWHRPGHGWIWSDLVGLGLTGFD
jgi:hypothetical protein